VEGDLIWLEIKTKDLVYLPLPKRQNGAHEH
jgi:hypothetical protein